MSTGVDPWEVLRALRARDLLAAIRDVLDEALRHAPGDDDA